MTTKQRPRTNWEITIAPPDMQPVTLRRRLTINSYLDWLDTLILDYTYADAITVHALNDDGTRRLITTTTGCRLSR